MREANLAAQALPGVPVSQGGMDHQGSSGSPARGVSKESQEVKVNRGHRVHLEVKVRSKLHSSSN